MIRIHELICELQKIEKKSGRNALVSIVDKPESGSIRADNKLMSIGVKLKVSNILGKEFDTEVTDDIIIIENPAIKDYYWNTKHTGQ